jgi:phenylacetate-CoA ligase
MFLRALAELYRLRRNEWLRPSALAEIQWRKLKRLLRHAYNNVPYYHRLFIEAGVTPEDIKCPQDLSKIPITTKSQIQDLAPEEIMATGYGKEKCLVFATSGSTGRPLSVFVTKEERDLSAAAWARGCMDAGLKWTDKRVHIHSSSRDHPSQKYWFQRLGIMSKEYISLYDREEDAFEILAHGNIDILSSQPSVLKMLCEHLGRREDSRLHPRLIFSISALLDAPTRRQVEDFFQAPVFDFYGMREAGLIAWQCQPCYGFHLNVDNQLLEFVRKGKSVPPGRRGKIIVTSLHSYSMPFIRYDTEDVGILSKRPCPCGRGLPLLERLEGRCDDFVSLPDGRVLPPVFIEFMRNLKWIRQYRIVQEKIDELAVYLVLEANPPPDLAESVKNRIKARIGESVRIALRIVDEIPPDRSGKLRSVISYVPVNF